MGKKRTRSKVVSKGTQDSVSRQLLKAVSRNVPEVDKVLNKLKHWAKGKRTVVTIVNPNKNETNKRFIKVEGNHSAAFGPWKRVEKEKNNS